jgi:hypothetical protein
MSLSRDQYKSLLAQLAENINIAEQKLNCLKIQEKVSQLFLQLNDSPTKVTCIPVSSFLSAITSSPTFFKFEDAGEVTFTINRDREILTCSAENCTCYFMNSELEQLCKNAQWDEDRCEMKFHCYRISPSWSLTEENSAESVTHVVPTVTSALKETEPSMEHENQEEIGQNFIPMTSN